jgi:hypothetical protein
VVGRVNVRRPVFHVRRLVAAQPVLVVPRVTPPGLTGLDVQVPDRVERGARHQLEPFETAAQQLLAVLSLRHILGHTDVVLDGAILERHRKPAVPNPPDLSIRPNDPVFVVEWLSKLLCGQRVEHALQVVGMNGVEKRTRLLHRTPARSSPYSLVGWADVQGVLNVDVGDPKHLGDRLGNQPQALFARASLLLHLTLLGDVYERRDDVRRSVETDHRRAQQDLADSAVSRKKPDLVVANSVTSIQPRPQRDRIVGRHEAEFTPDHTHDLIARPSGEPCECLVDVDECAITRDGHSNRTVLKAARRYVWRVSFR